MTKKQKRHTTIFDRVVLLSEVRCEASAHGMLPDCKNRAVVQLWYDDDDQLLCIKCLSEMAKNWDG